MKKIISISMMLVLLVSMTACASSDSQNTQSTAGQESIIQQATLAISTTAEIPTAPIQQEVAGMPVIQIQINQQTFTAVLNDNAAARALAAQLPMTVVMSELNGNEKYYNLPDGLPASPSNIGQIRNGDLMLYGSDCLVLFYETFSTSYRYTPLGHIDNPSGLAAAVGRGGVTVTLSVQ